MKVGPRRASRIAIVAAVVLGGAFAWSNRDVDLAAGNVNLIHTLGDLESLELSLEGGTWQAGYSPTHAGRFVEPFPEAIERIEPVKCRELGLIGSLVTPADSGSQDLVEYLGGIRVMESADSYHYASVGFRVRVFDEPAESIAFLDAVRDAARACPNGYTMDVWACDECQTEHGPVGVAAVGAVSFTAGTRRGGGAWVIVEERDQEASIQDYIDVDTLSTYYLAYGNVVVAIENRFEPDGELGPLVPLRSDSVESLVQQIVDQLGE